MFRICRVKKKYKVFVQSICIYFELKEREGCEGLITVNEKFLFLIM